MHGNEDNPLHGLQGMLRNGFAVGKHPSLFKQIIKMCRQGRPKLTRIVEREKLSSPVCVRDRIRRVKYQIAIENMGEAMNISRSEVLFSTQTLATKPILRR